MIISHCETARDNIDQVLKATLLFRKTVPCQTVSLAAEILSQQQVDVICCPYPDKESNLSALLLKLQERDEWRDIPLLLFSRKGQNNDRTTALELGASDCLALDLAAREAAVQIGWHLKNKHRIEQLRRSQADLTRKAVTDGLTGLYNRGYFDANLDQQIAFSLRADRPVTLLLADLDHFKAINDTYGHSAGDRALQGFARLLKQSSRKSDIVCRYGGEEFAVILPGCSSDQAYQAAERLRKKVAEYDFGFPLTVSIGLACSSTMFSCTASQLVENADSALYCAKEQGRNHTQIYAGLSAQTVQPFVPQQHSPAPKSALVVPLRRSFAALRKAARYSFI